MRRRIVAKHITHRVGHRLGRVLQRPEDGVSDLAGRQPIALAREGGRVAAVDVEIDHISLDARALEAIEPEPITRGLVVVEAAELQAQAFSVEVGRRLLRK